MADPWLDSDSEVTQVALAVASGRVGKPCSVRYVRRHARLRTEVDTTPFSWHGLPRGVLDHYLCGRRETHRVGQAVIDLETEFAEEGGFEAEPAQGATPVKSTTPTKKALHTAVRGSVRTHAGLPHSRFVRSMRARTYVRTYVRTSADTVRIAGAGLVLCIGLVFVGLFLVWCQCFFLWRHP